MIYDCFTYLNEDRMLDLRLRILDAHVDKFVIAEATSTFTGRPRSLHFDPARHAQFADRIIYVRVVDMPAGGSAWDREHHQRNALLRGLGALQDTDRVMVSDVDEIPDPGLIARYDPKHLRARFHMHQSCYFVNNMMTADEYGKNYFAGTTLTTGRHMRRFYKTPQNCRIFKPTGAARSCWRFIDKHRTQIIEGGWHMSWIMTPQQMLQKLASFSHTEFNTPALASLPRIQQSLADGRDILGRDMQFRVVEPDARHLPRHLVDNLLDYQDWLAPV